MRPDLDLRLVRAFVAVAEELHFTRAAQRLYVAQQALSRDIARLEADLDARLLTRSTRRVALTGDGERFLVHARALLALNDAALAELRGDSRPLVVDVIGAGLTPARIVEAARAADPRLEIVTRAGGGLAAALPHLLAGRLDVAFGRAAGLGPWPRGLDRRTVRHEPLGLLLLDDDPLAGRADVPFALLSGREVDASSGNENASEWVDLAESLLREHGARPSAPHPHAEGPGETARHLRAHGLPILTMTDGPPVEGAVVRPLVDPVPLYPWSMVTRRGATHPALAALVEAAARLAAAENWA